MGMSRLEKQALSMRGQDADSLPTHSPHHRDRVTCHDWGASIFSASLCISSRCDTAFYSKGGSHSVMILSGAEM